MDAFPLEFVPTDALLAELAKRYPTAVFAGQSVTADERAAPGILRMWGMPTLCLGLIRRLDIRAEIGVIEQGWEDVTPQERGGDEEDDSDADDA